MKILVVSSSPWRDDNNIGNSYTNIFYGMPNIEIAHICCGSGIPKTDFVKKNFHINERSIINNLINKKYPCGYVVDGSQEEDLTAIGSKSGLFDFVRKHRFQCFFFLRDLIWSFKNWKCNELNMFVDDFNPDVIFAPFHNVGYLNDMIQYLKEYIKKPVIVYAWDDVYTLRQFSISPLFWINRLVQRSKLRKISTICSRMYVISELQKKEYSKIFHHNCKVIYKGFDFNDEPIRQITNTPLKIVYTGNICYGRWRTLALLGSSLKGINHEQIKAQLFIYTATPLSNKMKRALNSSDAVKLMGHVSANDISKIQEEADILVHVESFNLSDRLKVRLSFSTKLVDYFKCAKCIFAVGSKEVASINYLIKNDAAVVAINKNEISTKLNQILKSYDIRKEYGDKAWACGRKNHQISRIQSNILQDLNALCINHK